MTVTNENHKVLKRNARRSVRAGCTRPICNIRCSGPQQATYKLVAARTWIAYSRLCCNI